MTWFISITIGVLVATGTYLIMQRRVIQVILGFSLLSHATNLMIVASGWIGDGRARVNPVDIRRAVYLLSVGGLILAAGVAALLLVKLAS